MKNNRGFTLIELMAIILLLALIALIATGPVGGVIELSKKSAHETTGTNLVEAAKKLCKFAQLDEDTDEVYYKDIRTYALHGKAAIADVVEIGGDTPDFENFNTYEYDDDCNVKLLFQDGDYACTNLADDKGNNVYDYNDGVSTTEKVVCSKSVAVANTRLIVDDTEETIDENLSEIIGGSEGEEGEPTKNNNGDSLDGINVSDKDSIYHMYFVNTNVVPSNAAQSWNVSENGNIKAWTVLTPNSESFYDLYIGSKGKIMAPKNSSHLFDGFKNLVSIDFGNFYVDNVENMSHMFNELPSIISLDLSGWNTSKVTDMSHMFNMGILVQINADLSDLSGLSGIGMITAGSNNNISAGTPSSLTTIEGLDGFVTTSVSDMTGMFSDNGNLISVAISNWDVSNVTNMSKMFFKDSGITNLDLSRWNTSNVTDMSNMFKSMSNLVSLKVSGWNTSKVTNMSGMFSSTATLSSLDISGFDTSNVTDMSSMFANLQFGKEVDLSSWNTSKVTDMSYMFASNNQLEVLNLSGWNTSKVTDLSYMFSQSKKLKTIYVKSGNYSEWNGNTNSVKMFYNDTSLVGGQGAKYNSRKITSAYANTDLEGYFTDIDAASNGGSSYNGGSGSTPDLTNPDVGNEGNCVTTSSGQVLCTSGGSFKDCNKDATGKWKCGSSCIKLPKGLTDCSGSSGGTFDECYQNAAGEWLCAGYNAGGGTSTGNNSGFEDDTYCIKDKFGNCKKGGGTNFYSATE